MNIREVLVGLLLKTYLEFYAPSVTSDKKGAKVLISIFLYVIYRTMVASLLY